MYRNSRDPATRINKPHQWTQTIWDVLANVANVDTTGPQASKSRHPTIRASVESDQALQDHLKYVEKRYKTLHADEKLSEEELALRSVSRTADALYVLGHAEESVEANNLSSPLLDASVLSSSPVPHPLSSSLPVPSSSVSSRFRKRSLIFPLALSLAAAAVPSTAAFGTVTLAGTLSLPSVRKGITKRG